MTQHSTQLLSKPKRQLQLLNFSTSSLRWMSFCHSLLSKHYLVVLLFSFYNFIYFWLSRVFGAVQALVQLQRVRAALQLQWPGFSLQWLLFLWIQALRVHRLQQLRCEGSAVVVPRTTGQSTGSVVVAHGLSYSVVCGIFPDQGWNLCLLHQLVDSLPLSHQ